MRLKIYVSECRIAIQFICCEIRKTEKYIMQIITLKEALLTITTDMINTCPFITKYRFVCNIFICETTIQFLQCDKKSY